MKNLCLILVAITATFPTLQAQSAAPHAEAKTAADTTVRSLVDSWNRADGIAYGENYWPVGKIFDGRAAIAQLHIDLGAGKSANLPSET